MMMERSPAIQDRVNTKGGEERVIKIYLNKYNATIDNKILVL